MKLQAQAKGGSSYTIQLFGEIGGADGISASEVNGLLHSLPDAREFAFEINSPGGDVFDALTIYNILVAHPAKIVTKVVGAALSGASLVVQAGDERLACENAVIMCHRAWTIAMGNAGAFRETAKTLDVIDTQMTHSYVTRTRLSRAKITSMLEAETWMTAQEARANGFVDRIVAPSSIAKAAIDPRRFRNIPTWVERKSPTPELDRALVRLAEHQRETEGRRYNLDELERKARVGAAQMRGAV